MASKDKKPPEGEAAVQAASIAAHPRAKVAIRRARSRTALAAFVLVLLFGHHAGLTWFDATWRALVAGIAANLVAWRCALFIWRAIIIAELRQAEQIYAERRRQAIETLERRAAEAAAGFQAA